MKTTQLVFLLTLLVILLAVNVDCSLKKKWAAWKTKTYDKLVKKLEQTYIKVKNNMDPRCTALCTAFWACVTSKIVGPLKIDALLCGNPVDYHGCQCAKLAGH